MAAATSVNNLQAYKRHIVSDALKDRHPYLEDINSHLKHDEVSMAFGDRVFPRLVEQLKTPTLPPEKLAAALRTVCDLCSHQENKYQAITSDVVAAATNLLSHDSVEVKREAARVISSMSYIIGGRSCMPAGNTTMPRKLTGNVLPGPTLPRLSKLLLSCDDEIVKKNVADAFCAVTVFRDGCNQVVIQGAVKATAQYLCYVLPALPTSEEQTLCLLSLLRMLAAVTMYARGGMQDIFGTGLVAKIITFLGAVIQTTEPMPAPTSEQATETVRQALRTLWHCGNDPVGRKEMLDADGVQTITAYLGHQDAKAREAVVCALNVIALETRGKQEVLRHSTEGLALLLHSDQETAYLHETCVQLCRCASELPAFRYAFALHILRSIWLLEKIFGTTALSAVSPLLSPTVEPDTRAEAARVMAHFLKAEKPAVGDEIRVPPVAPLQYIDDPPMYCIEHCTGVVRSLLMLLEVAREPALECLELLTKAKKAQDELSELLQAGAVPLPPEDLEVLRGVTAKSASGEPRQGAT